MKYFIIMLRNRFSEGDENLRINAVQIHEKEKCSLIVKETKCSIHLYRWHRQKSRTK